MTSVLITSFEPYGDWKANASWLALVELTRNMPEEPRITTRLYPVDFSQVERKLGEDLAANYDVALHLGQAPGATKIRLEAFGLNIKGEEGDAICQTLVPGGPAAYQSELPLDDWAEEIRAAGIPATVSHHAGTYLCNGTLYLSHHLCATRGLRTRSAFVHVPLDTSQVVGSRAERASLPRQLTADALRLLLQQIAQLPVAADSTL